jgi:hypothetical protein
MKLTSLINRMYQALHAMKQRILLHIGGANAYEFTGNESGSDYQRLVDKG